LLSTFAGQGTDLKPWLSDAVINSDRNLRLQYLAGLGLNLYQADAIYRNMVSFARFPQSLFTGSDGYMQRLRQTMAFPQNQ
jgi:spermidine synthase